MTEKKNATMYRKNYTMTKWDLFQVCKASSTFKNQLIYLISRLKKKNYMTISAIKRNEIVPFAEMWIDLETVIQSEVSQKEKNKYHIILLICGI